MKRACWVMVAAYACAVQAAPPERSFEEALALYEEGRYGAALRLIADAAEAGHVRAQEVAGLMLLAGPKLYGNEVPRDAAAGRAWLIRAAGAGSEVGRHFACRSGDATNCRALSQASTRALPR